MSNKRLTGPLETPRALTVSEASDLVAFRHREWSDNVTHWQFLMDSLDSGETYKGAEYGQAFDGNPLRNLIRHRREGLAVRGRETLTGSAGGVALFTANPDASSGIDDYDYEERLARTPAPYHMAEVIYDHRDRIYSQEIRRTVPAKLSDWYKDVDGSGKSFDDWAKDTAPILMATGVIDVQAMPRNPITATPILSREDEARQGTDKCSLSIILPTNMLWWYLDEKDRYIECLVREFYYDYSGAAVECFRHWTRESCGVYDAEGKAVELIRGGVKQPSWGLTNLGFVPIRRVCTGRKPRTSAVGWARYEAVADYQKAIYNKESELSLSDSRLAHPSLQGPAEYVTGSEIKIGPDAALPVPESDVRWDWASPDKTPSESIRKSIESLESKIRTFAGTSKPSGEASGEGTVAGQSGVSKMIDRDKLDNLLRSLAASLQEMDVTASALAWSLMEWKEIDPAKLQSISVTYPQHFNMGTADDYITNFAEITALLPELGRLPALEKPLLKLIAREILRSKTQDEYKVIDDAIDVYVESMGDELDDPTPVASPINGVIPPVTPPPAAGQFRPGVPNGAGFNGRNGQV